MKKKTVKKTKGRRNEETKKRRNEETKEQGMQCTKEKKQRRISERTEGQETTQWAYDPNQVSQSDQWLLPLTEFKLLSATTSIDTQHSRNYLFLETKSIMIALRHSTPPPPRPFKAEDS